MTRIQKMIIIGATARHSGKTELAAAIIKKFCREIKIIGIKISTMREGDKLFHGKIENLNENFIIEKNITTDRNKSTDRMLLAGAYETYWVHTKSEYINNALQELLPLLDKNAYIICESNNIRKVVIPDIFLMIQNKRKPVKQSALDVMKLADLIINFNGKDFINFDISNIIIDNLYVKNSGGVWKLNKFIHNKQ